jgi:hypothetical protein
MTHYPYRIVTNQYYRNETPIHDLRYKVEKHKRMWWTLFLFKSWVVEGMEKSGYDGTTFTEHEFESIEEARSYIKNPNEEKYQPDRIYQKLTVIEN